ncbi:MAG: UDP-glucose 4-epimerase GalE [Planctomycetes bacterium]|jgi:UDP-glucose 4-epimerase|nr:UDP-glucose 4-epimerase GalE [Planctomycetota bacterium]
MNIAVIGAAGYIGSHAVKLLVERGHHVTAIDNLTEGHRAAVHPKARLVVLDCANTAALATVLGADKIEAVMHFAASAYVGESVQNPRKYYRNNVSNTISMLDAMNLTGVKKLVFSSTCATYGEPQRVPITEDLPQNPISPYGHSKLMVENILKDTARAEGLAFAAPRYFNVAGAALDGSIGEDHRPETHLLPIVLQVALGQRPAVEIFGQDYPTPDGTCIRDYIHVWDLVEAHLVLLEHLQPGRGLFYNLGVGRGYSVREIIDACRKVTGKPIPTRETARRPGDPPALFASPERMAKDFSWKAKITDLHVIVESAWRWLQTHPNGYG